MPGYVYMLSNRRHGTLYVGVTNDIVRRVHEHRTGAVDGFTKRHGLHRLAFFETHETVPLAIEREKRLKRWKRDWKVRLIEETNPDWDDLYPGLTR
jgi:putative endonuclease